MLITGPRNVDRIRRWVNWWAIGHQLAHIDVVDDHFIYAAVQR